MPPSSSRRPGRRRGHRDRVGRGPKFVTVTPGRRKGATVQFTVPREEERTPRSCGPRPETCDGDTREEERCHRHIRTTQGGGEGVRFLWRGTLCRAMLTEFRSAFVGCLVCNAAKLGLVQSKVLQFAVAQCAQFAQGVAVNLAACRFGAIFCHKGVHPIHDSVADCADTVCFVCHVSALFEFLCFRSLETKISKCCTCTIAFCLNAAMQHLHRPGGSILCVLR